MMLQTFIAPEKKCCFPRCPSAIHLIERQVIITVGKLPYMICTVLVIRMYARVHERMGTRRMS